MVCFELGGLQGPHSPLFNIFSLLPYSSSCTFCFSLDNEKPMRVVDDDDLVDQHLISELRKEYGMTYDDFFMVLTDVDLRVKVCVFL